MLRGFWVDLTLAYRNIARYKRRSAIAIGAVAFGIAALILAAGFIERILVDFREDTIKSRLGHLQITRPNYHSVGKADPYAYLLPRTLPELSPSAYVQQIKAVAPRLSFSGLISHGDATLSFIGDAVDPGRESAFDEALQVSSGKHLTPEAVRGALLGEGLARNLGVGVGDRIVLLANTAHGGTNAIEMSVVGLFSSATKAYDDAALRIPLQAARELLRTDGAHVWVVLLNDTAATDEIMLKLRERLPSKEYEIVPWYALSDFYNKSEVLFRKQVQGLRLIIAIIILLSITNTMMMSVMQRIGEIGTSMALGVKRSRVMRLFLVEGMLLGCIGGLLGVAIGTGLAWLISTIGIPMPAPPGKTHGYIGGVLATANMGLEAVVLAVVTTLAASIVPAARASRLQIVDALRHNR